MFTEKITGLVEKILKESPSARGDDKILQMKVWQAQGLPMNEAWITKFLSDSIANPESIRRTRQKIQEEGRYLPAKEVVEARKDLAEATKIEVVNTRMFDNKENDNE